VRGRADGDGGQARHGADARCDHHQPELAGADLAAQEDQRLQRQPRQSRTAAWRRLFRERLGADGRLVDLATLRGDSPALL